MTNELRSPLPVVLFMSPKINTWTGKETIVYLLGLEMRITTGGTENDSSCGLSVDGHY